MKKIIIDLDNTIYPVSSIGEKLFKPLLTLLSEKKYGLSEQRIKKAKEQIMRVPFQKVADQFEFPEDLTQNALNLLRTLRYDDEINYFSGYEEIRRLQTDKFLLTTGFKNLQESKIRSLKIESDFKEVFIVDPDHSLLTKKDVMIQIMDKYQLKKEELIVIGDDPESEIKAGNELDIVTYLIDADCKYLNSPSTYTGKNLKDVIQYLE